VLHTHFTQPSNRRKETDSAHETQTQTQAQAFPTSIPSIYAKPPDPFPAVTRFVESSSLAYHLDLVHISTNPGPRPGHGQQPQSSPSTAFSTLPRVTFRDAFARYLQSHPGVRAIFVGTRRTDPHGTHLTHFDRTDHGWPDFMRIHPVIDWHLSEIWCFLRAHELKEPDGTPLPYCEMYDQGYTSLGGVGDTVRNPKLKYLDADGIERYWPAYHVTEDEEERLGRE